MFLERESEVLRTGWESSECLPPPPPRRLEFAVKETKERKKDKKQQKKNISEWSGEQFKEKTLYLEEDTTVQMKADTDLEGQAHSKGRFIHRAVILKHKHASSCTPPTPSAAVPFG